MVPQPLRCLKSLQIIHYERSGKRRYSRGAERYFQRKSPRVDCPQCPVPPINGQAQQDHSHILPVSHAQRNTASPYEKSVDETLQYPSPARSIKDESPHKGDPLIKDLENEDVDPSLQVRPTRAKSVWDHESLAGSDYGDFSLDDEDLSNMTLLSYESPGPKLSAQQAEVVQIIMNGRNVFYTGAAGCGKSAVLNNFVGQLRALGKNVDIIAPTGRAALDINGCTIWTYAGWVPSSMKMTMLELERRAHGRHVWKRLTWTDVLVIDEISMLENLHFERLSHIMKSARGSDKAFGGVQIVVTGDFCQLPPVKPWEYCMHCGRTLETASPDTKQCLKHGIFHDIDKWAFRSAAWSECGFVYRNLTEIHRQDDLIFINILKKCRLGRQLSREDLDLLLHHPSDTDGAVKLFPTRPEVKVVNDTEFARLPYPIETYSCLDNFDWNLKHLHLENKFQPDFNNPENLRALREHRYEAALELKKDMLVVLLANLDIPGGLVNGSQGVIVSFEDHKPKLLPEPGGDLAMHKKELIGKYIWKRGIKRWPVVRFHNGRERSIYAECTVNELGEEKPYSLLSRTQVPLMAAWAMTVHKAQGMTLSRVIVDLGKAFEEGQSYVALSRARDLEGLKVEALGHRSWGCNQQVREFLWEHGWID